MGRLSSRKFAGRSIRFVRGWGMPVLLVGASIAVIHFKLLQSSTPSSNDIKKYLQTGQLRAGEETVNNYRHVYYEMDGVVVHITKGEANHVLPVVSGSRIVWLEQQTAGNQVFLYDVLMGYKTQLTFVGAHQRPAVSSTLVAWESWNDASPEVQYYDGKVVRTIRVDGDAARPVIHEGLIGFVRKVGANRWQLMKFNVETQQLESLQEVPAKDAYPRFKDGKLVPGPYRALSS